MSNIELAEKLIAQLVQQGVRDFTVCAGARNAPLVKVLGALAQAESIEVRYFFEERSAAFFALGRARRESRPTCVVTTSGTAVAELMPAAVEAYYSSVPLVLVTADRPASYRGTGAPQTIDQINIFGQYAGSTVIWDASMQGKPWLHSDYATHVNISFDEPLLDAPVTVRPEDLNTWMEGSTWRKPDLSQSEGWDKPAMYSADALSTLTEKFQRPLIIVSEMTKDGASLAAEILAQLQVPVYYEAASQLRGSKFPNALLAFDRNYSIDQFRENYDGVIRIGGVPTHRIWRDLDLQLREVPVLSFSEREFSGLSRSAPVLPLKNLESLRKLTHADFAELKSQDEVSHQELIARLDRFPKSEATEFRHLSEAIPEGSLVFLSNSLPIRQWDHFAGDSGKNLDIAVMRGVNGIDGVISHFLGRAERGKENWLILGDLTALYDLAGLALKSAAQSEAVRVVVVNNGGGKIFAPMFEDANFENRHSFSFEGLARTFGWDYYVGIPSSTELQKKTFALIELLPDEAQTLEFQAEYKS